MVAADLARTCATAYARANAKTRCSGRSWGTTERRPTRAIANPSTFSSVHAGSTTGIWVGREGFELFVSHPESNR
jgi:hypothetical protein